MKHRNPCLLGPHARDCHDVPWLRTQLHFTQDKCSCPHEPPDATGSGWSQVPLHSHFSCTPATLASSLLLTVLPQGLGTSSSLHLACYSHRYPLWFISSLNLNACSEVPHSGTQFTISISCFPLPLIYFLSYNLLLPALLLEIGLSVHHSPSSVERTFGLFCLLMYPQCLRQCLAHSWCSANIGYTYKLMNQYVMCFQKHFGK